MLNYFVICVFRQSWGWLKRKIVLALRVTFINLHKTVEYKFGVLDFPYPRAECMWRG